MAPNDIDIVLVLDSPQLRTLAAKKTNEPRWAFSPNYLHVSMAQKIQITKGASYPVSFWRTMFPSVPVCLPYRLILASWQSQTGSPDTHSLLTLNNQPI